MSKESLAKTQDRMTKSTRVLRDIPPNLANVRKDGSHEMKPVTSRRVVQVTFRMMSMSSSESTTSLTSLPYMPNIKLTKPRFKGIVSSSIMPKS